MIAFINDLFDIVAMYVQFLFSLEILPDISIGSIFLVASVFFVIVTNLWIRRMK